MDKTPLEAIKKLDPAFFDRVGQIRAQVFQDGALPAKTKLLIAMALDAAAGTSTGVASLARQAMQKGATREEISEALQVTHYINGVGSVYTASAGLSEVLP